MRYSILLIIFSFSFSSLFSQNIYEYKKEFWSKKEIRLTGKSKVYLINKTDSLYWIDCNLSDKCFISSPFNYSIKNNILYYNYKKNGNDSILSFPQFSLIGDTLNYMDEEQIINNPNIIGQSFYIKDTVITSGKNRFECYYFLILNNIDASNPRNSISTTKIIIEKEKLIPVLIYTDYYDKQNTKSIIGFERTRFIKEKKYYLLKKRLSLP